MTQVKGNRRILRVVSLLTALVMLLSVPYFGPLNVNADVTSERKLIRWHRVFTQADIKTGPMILCWGGSGTNDYVSVGGGESGWSMLGTAASKYDSINDSLRNSLDVFYTFADEVTNYWSIEFLGKYDSKNNNLKKCHLRVSRKPGEGGGYIWNDFTWHMFGENEYNLELGSGNPEDSDFDWTVVTNGTGCSYERSTGYGYVQLFHEYSGGVDDELYGNGDKISCRGNSSYNLYDFIMYIGEEVTATEYDSFTVRSGQTFALENISILKTGCTITIEPGAVLRVADQFVNNGTIKNYGMYLIDEDAVVTTWGTYNSSAGAVFNYGHDQSVKGITGQTMKGEGNMIVLGGAVYALTKSNADIVFYEGTSLHLNGLLSVNKFITFFGAEAVIGDTGSLLVNYLFPERLMGSGKTLQKSKQATAEKLKIGPDGLPSTQSYKTSLTFLTYGKPDATSRALMAMRGTESYVRIEGRLYVYTEYKNQNVSQAREIALQQLKLYGKVVFDIQDSADPCFVLK